MIYIMLLAMLIVPLSVWGLIGSSIVTFARLFVLFLIFAAVAGHYGWAPYIARLTGH